MVEDADRGRGPLRYGLPPNVSQYSDPYGRKDSILEPRGRFDDSEEAYLHGMSEEETQRRGWKAGGPYPRDPANPLDNPYPRRVFHPIGTLVAGRCADNPRADATATTEIPGTRGRLIDPEIVNREATVNRAMSAIEQASFSSLSVVPCVLTRVVERRASRGLAGSDGRRDPASRLNHNFGMDRPDGRQRCVPHIERDPNHPRYGLQRTHDGTSAGVPLNRKRPSRRDDLELRDRLGAVYDETAPSLTSDRGLVRDHVSDYAASA